MPALRPALSILMLLTTASATLPGRADCARTQRTSSHGVIPTHGNDRGEVADGQLGCAEADRIHRVPGFAGELSSAHFSGYVKVGASKQLFYYLAESQGNPAEDPVVLWLNGGPGCSSMDGFTYEHGPFTFTESAPGDATDLPVKLMDNPFSWNKAANVIYLDSPAGVGLSYSEDPHDYVTGDGQTAADADAFLREFFRRHSRFHDNDFYITGESYAGIYVPNLARQVIASNAAGASPKINIVGYAVGNGCTDEAVDGDAIPGFAVGLSLISQSSYDQLHTACGGGVYWNRTAGSECDKRYSHMMSQLSGLNIYNVLGKCYHGAHASESRAALEAARAENPRGVWPLSPGATPLAGLQSPPAVRTSLGYDPPCTDARVASAWLNDASVRRAIHAAPLDSAAGLWTLCQPRIAYMREIGSMIPIHRDLIENHGLRALVYSGDHDLCVPHTGSERWTAALGYDVDTPWAPWFYDDQQVAGYAVEYSPGLTFATVKGAGHMVPQTNPRESFAMFNRFVSRRSLHDSD
uniref:Carboxypeptidase n=1 Tax=Chlamydomonas euryale TaxID=1486919 RepID=A0A7R9V9E4_9CHLO